MKQTNKNILLILFLATLFTASAAEAQNITNSIYSRFGYGTERFKGFAQNSALGSTGVAQSGYWNLNYYNPASNAALKLTSFNAGFTGTYSKQFNDVDTITNKGGNFGYLALGFPVTKWWGLSFGVLPYTGVGYKMSDTAKFKNMEIASTFHGEGGLNKVYMAHGLNPFRIFSDSLMRGFAIGLNTDFTFGSIERHEYKTFVHSDTSFYLNMLNTTRNAYHGFSFLLGAQQTFFINTDTRFTLGFSYGFKAKLVNNASINSERYYNAIIASNLVDTAYYSQSNATEAYLPSQYSFGCSLQMGPKFVYTMEYKVINWAKDSIDKNLNALRDSRTITTGIQYYPNVQNPDGFLKHTYYRFGFKNTVTPFYLNNTQILEQAFTLGAGFPLRKSVSTVNVGLEFGRRGTTAYYLVQENYMLLNVGFTINDRWFIKSKYD